MRPLPQPEGNKLFLGGTLDDPQFTAHPDAKQYNCYNCGREIWFNVRTERVFHATPEPKARVCIACFKRYEREQGGEVPLIRV